MTSSTQVNSAFGRLLHSVGGHDLPEWETVQPVLLSLSPGDTVFGQDTANPYLYAVQHGLFKLRYLDAEGHEWIKSFVHDGGFFASVAALSEGGRTSFEVVALEDSVVERIAHRRLEQLAARHLPWARALQALTLMYAARKEQRERELLTLSAEARYRAFCEAQPALLQRLPQKELARHLGVTAVGLSRIAVRVRRQGPWRQET